MTDRASAPALEIENPYQGNPQPFRREKPPFGRMGARALELSVRQLFRWISSRHMRRYDLFESIEIETINRCNNDCSFCPVNTHVDPRPLARMTEEVYRKIIDELAEARYRESICFHSNNEPYLDKQLIPRIAYARQRCPGAFLSMYTNGTALNRKRFTATIDAGLNYLIIDNYNDALELNENIAELVGQLGEPGLERYRRHAKIVLRKKNEVISSRAGNAPNKTPDVLQEYAGLQRVGCPLPSRQLVVRPTGEVSLCCNDALGQVTLGDVRKQSLREIWHGPEYAHVREVLQREGRGALELCKVCDTLMPKFEHRLLVQRRVRRTVAAPG